LSASSWDPSGEQTQARGLSRRQLLQRSAAAAVGVPSLAAFLEACSKKPSAGGGPAPTGSGGSTASAKPTFSVASPANPVKWPIYDDNKPIASGLTPESDATLNVYTYVDYFDKGAIKSFQDKYKKYNVKVTITTFEDTTEAIGKIRTGGVQADIYNPSYDQIGKMITAKLLQPLNHDYIPNIANVWPTYTNPFYDQEWQYTTPYVLYGTGIAWRTDLVHDDVSTMTNPYDILWDTKYAKKISVLDDYRTCMGMVLLRNNLSVNTTKDEDLALVGKQLTELNKTMSPKVNVTDYTDLPNKIVSLCQVWAGDAVNMMSYLPKNDDGSELRYWSPKGQTDMCDNDLLVPLRSSKAPVMTHLLLNHMLDYEVAIGTFSFTGYQPPQNKITPSELVSSQFIPQNLSSAVVEQADWENGQHILELPPDVDAKWQEVWQQFKAGA
jgi:spermidine/putrescine transport system substrate-binding protein